jgi:hypothetical protein
MFLSSSVRPFSMSYIFNICMQSLLYTCILTPVLKFVGNINLYLFHLRKSSQRIKVQRWYFRGWTRQYSFTPHEQTHVNWLQINVNTEVATGDTGTKLIMYMVMCAVIVVFTVANIIAKISKRTKTKTSSGNQAWKKVLAATRFLSYKGFHIRGLKWYSPSIGVMLLGCCWSGVVNTHRSLQSWMANGRLI